MDGDLQHAMGEARPSPADHRTGAVTPRRSMPRLSRPSVAEPKAKARPKVERPRMYKVLLVNDDFTPREFVVMVLRRVFGMTPERAHGVMMTAHRRGCCVVAVYTREIAETKATQATDAGREAGYPLLFTTEPEE